MLQPYGRIGRQKGTSMGLPTVFSATEPVDNLARSEGNLDLCGACDRIHEADHRIANHLAMLGGYLRLKSHDLLDRPGEPTKADVRLLLESVEAQIGAVARLHRSLATTDVDATVDLGDHLRDLCEPFQAGLAGSIQVISELPPGCIVRPDEILPLTQIVSEVLTNAVKYAYPSPAGGPIHIRCRQDADGLIEIVVADEGQGLPETFNSKVDGGLGFRLIRALGRQLDADLAFVSSSSGAVFNLHYTPHAITMPIATVGSGLRPRPARN